METCRKMASTLAVEREDYKLKFEETELRLGLPGGGGGEVEVSKNSGGKRGFSETVNLELNLPTGGRKDGGVDPTEKMKSLAKEKNLLPTNDPTKPSASKAQVVGWPPVRSYRKNILTVQTGKSSGGSEEGEKVNGSGALVKVSMDGAPYLRKVDLKMYKSYQDLSNALEKMFSSFTTAGNCGSYGINGGDFINEKKLKDILNGSEYVPTYEDKDGDWMLVGDVPWDMFVESCKRLRLMKGSEAIGLACAPRAMEKCRNRN